MHSPRTGDELICPHALEKVFVAGRLISCSEHRHLQETASFRRGFAEMRSTECRIDGDVTPSPVNLGAKMHRRSESGDVAILTKPLPDHFAAEGADCTRHVTDVRALVRRRRCARGAAQTRHRIDRRGPTGAHEGPVDGSKFTTPKSAHV